MLKQGLQQKLLQKLSPQQIQFIKLLQVPTASLDTRIKEELEENPALEDGSVAISEHHNDYEFEDDKSGGSEDHSAEEQQEHSADEFNIDDYIQQEEKDYALGYDYNPDDDEDNNREKPAIVNNSFYESLILQLHVLDMDEQHYLICEQLIGSIDDDGYLRREIPALLNDLAFSRNVMTTEAEVLEALKLIQSFDPAGVGARDLQECLLLQLRRKEPITGVQLAIEIVEDHLDEFTKKHYEKLEKTMGISNKELKEAINEILKLNPRPGNASSDNSKELQIIPDFAIQNNDGVLILTLNGRNAPELRVSRQYRDMLEHYEKAQKTDKKMKEAVQFVRQKLDSAKWFIDAIKQRQQTLIKTMNAIMQFQYEYFLEGDERKLKPMILKDIADRIDMDISTVSRVANSKYVQTEFGTFLLKSFFSEGIQTDSGDEVSNREVKKILEEAISAEDKNHPLPDEQLADILQKRGYNIARRTIAKYREQLGIPVARLRKEMV